MLRFMEWHAVLACLAFSGITEVNDASPDHPAQLASLYGVIAIYFTLAIPLF